MSTQTLLMKCWIRQIEFDQVVPSLNGFLLGIAKRFSQYSHLNSIDDFYSIGLTSAWNSIENFRLVCPMCDTKFETIKAFAIHSIENHSKLLEPAYTITSYVKSRVASSLQRSLKSEHCIKRSPKKKITAIEFDLPDLKTSDDNSLVIFEDLVNSVLKDFTSQEKEVIDLLLKNYSIQEIITNFQVKTFKKSNSFVRRTIKRFRFILLEKYVA